MEKRNLPIGFMDSGLGGLSVLQRAAALLPAEDFIYYGDSLHAPYGTKSKDEIERLTFRATEVLMEQGIKALVVACNTATSAAIERIRSCYSDMPVIGVEPALKPAVLSTQGGRILVLATPMTIAQERFQKMLAFYSSQANIIPVSCEGLMEFVEQGILEGSVLESYFQTHLMPYLSEDTQAVVLGCTHYPFLKQALERYLFLLGRRVKLIDGSEGTAQELKRRLKERLLLRPVDGMGQIRIQNSTGKQEMIDLSWRLLHTPCDERGAAEIRAC